MALKTYKLGELIEPYNERCNVSNLSCNDVSGVNREKEFFEPSQSVGADTSNYKIVPIDYFACNLMHVGRDYVLPIALNHSKKKKFVSPAYTVFKIKRNDILLSEYFFMYLKSPNRDMLFWFMTDSSIRDGLNWDNLCDIDITLPDLPTQQKYVDIYESMVVNQKSYEKGLDDLKLTCDAFLDKLKKECKKERIGDYIEQSDLRNEDKKLTLDNVKGISIEKKFIETKADMTGVSLKPYYVVKPNYFAYVPVTSRNGDKITLALNQTDETYIVSSSYIVFKVNDELKLDPHYLMMFFEQSDFDRYARFNSWGSARESFDWSEMQEVKFPIPSINIQKSIANIYKVYLQRKSINEKLKAQIRDICSILIKGSMEEQ